MAKGIPRSIQRHEQVLIAQQGSTGSGAAGSTGGGWGEHERAWGEVQTAVDDLIKNVTYTTNCPRIPLFMASAGWWNTPP